MQRKQGSKLKKSGVILELNSKEAVVITSESRFVTIKRKPDMFVGQVVSLGIPAQLMSRYKYSGLISAASGIAALFIIAFITFTYMYLPSQNNVFAYIDVDINPSVELVIDDSYVVLDTKHLNEDAKKLLKGLKLEGMYINQALQLIVEKSGEYGFITSKSGNFIYVSASLNTQRDNYKQNSMEEEKKIDGLIRDIKQNIQSTFNQSIEVRTIKVSTQDRKLAQKNEISMGKYSILSEASKKGIDISAEEVKENTIKETLEKIVEKETARHVKDDSSVPMDNDNITDNDSASPTPSGKWYTVTPSSKPFGREFVEIPYPANTVHTGSLKTPTPPPYSDSEYKQTPGSPVTPGRFEGPETTGRPQMTHIPKIPSENDDNDEDNSNNRDDKDNNEGENNGDSENNPADDKDNSGRPTQLPDEGEENRPNDKGDNSLSPGRPPLVSPSPIPSATPSGTLYTPVPGNTVVPATTPEGEKNIDTPEQQGKDPGAGNDSPNIDMSKLVPSPQGLPIPQSTPPVEADKPDIVVPEEIIPGAPHKNKPDNT